MIKYFCTCLFGDRLCIVICDGSRSENIVSKEVAKLKLPIEKHPTFRVAWFRKGNMVSIT